MDFQAEQLQRAQAKATAANVTNVRFVQAGLGEGKLPEAAFDRALLCTVLGEILDREAALAEIFKALKPGGVLSVTEVLPDPHFQGMGTLRALARGAGFVEGEVIGNRLAYTMNLVKPDHAQATDVTAADLTGLEFNSAASAILARDGNPSAGCHGTGSDRRRSGAADRL